MPGELEISRYSHSREPRAGTGAAGDRRSEGALEHERSQLLSIFDSIDEVIYVADLQTHEILYANRAMQQKFGKGLVGGTCYREIQRKDAPCEFCTNPIILADRDRPHRWEFHNPTVNADFLIVDRVIRWPDGRDVRFEMAIDITDRKRAEEALRRSEARLNSIFRSVPAGIGVVVGRVIVEANERLCAMTGYAREELIGRDARVFYPTDAEYDRVGREKYALIREHGIGEIDTRWRRKDGELIDVLLRSTPVVPGDLAGEVTFTALDITERKRTEAAHARLASIVMSSDDAIIGKTLDGAITSWNRGAEKLYGYTADQAVGRPIDIIVPVERSHEVRDILGKIRRGERVEHYETERVTKGGRRIDVAITISPIADADGEVVGASTIARDITESKRAEAALRKSQFILAKSQEMARLGNWAWNLQTDELNLSDEGFRIFGFRPGEVPPTIERFVSLIHPGDRDAVGEFIRAAREGKRGSIDFRIVQRDGSVRYINSLADKFVQDRDGRPKWAYGIIQDITGRKLAEEKLRKSEFILAKSQEMAQVGNWAWNVQTDEMSGSVENDRIYGYRPGEVRPTIQWALSRVHPDDRGLVTDFIEGVRKEGKRGSIDYRIVRPDGAVRYANTLADRIVRDRAGNVKWVYGITQDITGRKHSENALEEAKARAELYIDLMGHDINNMNQIAQGFLEIALSDPGMGDETRASLARSLEAVLRSSRLIHNVRKLQQVKVGPVDKAATDVGQVLRQVQSTYSRASGDGTAIRLREEAPGCTVMANELLYDVFANIVDNAIKHGGSPPAVEVRLARTAADGREHVRVAVEDNGPGIPDDQKRAVFERLHRGNTKVRGSGLGLYLVKTLVGSFGGQVWVEDRVPGDHKQGARFVVLLPAA